MKKKMTVSHIIIVVVLILMALICLYPMWYTLICSVSDRAYVEGGRVWLVPKGLNLASYRRILKDDTFFASFFVSVKRVTVGCTLNLLLLVLTAYPLCLPQRRFPAGKYLKWFFMANMLFSGGMIPAYVLMRQYGLFDSFWSMILPGAVPLWNMILMINFFRNVTYELNESATIDGANPWQTLFRIYVPLSVPSLACLLLFQFVGHWNSYFDGLIYINDTAKQPLQTYIYQLSVRIDFSTMRTDEILTLLQTSDKTLQSAKVFVAMIPILVVYPFIQKYFTAGMTLGAVKG
nr:carbohydrate ABC transporter permease [uncultured Acetatifactor sp.]